MAMMAIVAQREHEQQQRRVCLRPSSLLSVHRYQVSVDGWTSPFDALMWKMSSNSTVFIVNPTAPPYVAEGPWIPSWFAPLYE